MISDIDQPVCLCHASPGFLAQSRHFQSVYYTPAKLSELAALMGMGWVTTAAAAFLQWNIGSPAPEQTVGCLHCPANEASAFSNSGSAG